MPDNYDKVSLLLPMNGANNGTVFDDYSPVIKTPVRSGSVPPTTVTAQSKFYGSSGFFPTNASAQSAHLRVVLNSGIGTGLFTIRGWVRISVASDTPIFNTRYNSGFTWTGSTAISFLFEGSPLKLKMYNFNTSTFAVSGATTVSLDTFHHVEISRDGSNVVRVFLDGVLDGSATVSGNFGDVYCAVGGIAATINFNERWLQDFEITLGECLHTATFTPPARLLGTISNAAVGAGKILNAAGNPAERTVIAVPRIAPTRTFSTVSNASGEFEIQAPAGVDHSVVALADEATLYNDIVHRVIPV